jgi:hypothetical protein
MASGVKIYVKILSEVPLAKWSGFDVSFLADFPSKYRGDRL